ncbi:excinuclease ABC subunit C [Enterococcus faecalis]|uniref:excinuclease ABC subunit C n=1 Tax=Enterococcus faecalis TaxID=1351 RepID=UPI0035E27C2B
MKEDTTTTSIAYVQCSCGCLASRVSSDLDKYKCSLCKRIYTIKKNSIMRNHKL